jgi:hypothetical protein
MHTRIYIAALLILGLACASGCSKHSTQAASGTVTDTPSSTAQAPSDANGKDNVASQSPGEDQTSVPLPPSIVIPTGTVVTVRLQQRLSSATAMRGQRFDAVLEQPLISGDRVVVPAGTLVEGHVVSARHSGRLHHPGVLSLTLDRLVINDREINLVTSDVVARGGSHKKRNWGFIGGGTGGGAVIGALAAGGKGALIGSGIGAAAGTTTAFITGKKDVKLHDERVLRFRLDQEVNLS